jgi:uncharacterized protein (TIGR00369 family)
MTAPAGFSLADARALLVDAFAPWVQDLGIAVERVERDGATLRMPISPRLHRSGGTVCGQSLMALADTAMVFAVSGANGAFRAMTTVTQTAHFLRPIAGADVLAEARVLRLGRAMAFGEVILRAAGRADTAVHVSTTYALLDEGR